MNFLKLEIPFIVISKGDRLILVDVQAVYEYKDGKRTESRIGTRYIVVAEDAGYEKFSVKVANPTPLLTAEQLQSSKQTYHVKFENAIAKPYRTQSGDFELSITATAVNFVKEL